MTAQELFEYLSAIPESERKEKIVCEWIPELGRAVETTCISPQEGLHYRFSKPKEPGKPYQKVSGKFLMIE